MNLTTKLNVIEYIYEPIQVDTFYTAFICKKSKDSPVQILLNSEYIPFDESRITNLTMFERLIDRVLVDQATLHYIEMQKILDLTGVSQDSMISQLEEFKSAIRGALAPVFRAKLKVVK